MCRLQFAAPRLDPDIPVKPSAIVLFIAGLIQRNPKRTTAAITAFLMGAGTFAMAALTPAEPPKLVRLVTESVQADMAGELARFFGVTWRKANAANRKSV